MGQFMKFTKNYVGNIKQNWKYVKNTFHFISAHGTTIDKLFYMYLLGLLIVILAPLSLLGVEPLERNNEN